MTKYWLPLFLIGILTLPNIVVARTKNILLMWQVHPNTGKDDLLKLRDMGVTTLQSFSLLNFELHDVEKYLELTSEIGLDVIAYLGPAIDYDDNGFCSIKNEWKLYLDTLARLESLFAWHTFDEPYFKAYAHTDCQISLYQELKRLYPKQKVFISLNNVRPAHYKTNFSIDAADIFDLHAYSNPNIGSRQEMMRKSARIPLLGKQLKPVIFTIRAFNDPSKNWKNIDSDSLSRAVSFAIEMDGDFSGYGFYGWDLSPNIGINNIQDVEEILPSLIKRLKNN